MIFLERKMEVCNFATSKQQKHPSTEINSFMRRLIFFLFFLQALLVRSIAQTGVFLPSERFSSMLINDLCQDCYGYIWIATDYGLNRFDGYHFTTYYHRSNDSTSLGSNIITQLYQDSQHRFWVGTRSGLYRYDQATDRFVYYPTGDNRVTRITSLLERKNGEMLVGTSGHGLWAVSGDSLRKIPDGYTTPSGNWYYNQMMEDSQGRFWKCGYGDELTMKDDKGVHQMFVDQGIICGIIERDSEMLIIGQHGISSYSNGQVSHADIELGDLGYNEIVVCSAMKDHAGNIYIGTMGDGLFRLPAGSRKVERVECTLLEMDLNTAKISSISEDRYGNIWLGCQSKGLVLLPSQQPQFAAWSFLAQHYFIGSTITSVCEGDDGLTWCTVPGSGVFAFDATGRIVSHPAAPIATEYLFHDRHGRYWLATDKELYNYDPVTGRFKHHINLTAEKVNAIVDDEAGNLYISTYSRGFCVYNPTTHALRQFNATDALSPKGNLWNNWIQAMMCDSGGHIWLATAVGVSCYDPSTDSFRALGFDKLLDGTICFSLCETRDGNILIGTDQGLYCYKRGATAAVPYPDDEALRDKTISYIAQDDNNDLWCATSMGIWQYDAQSQKLIGHVNGNGLNAKEYICGVGMKTADGVIYFANTYGLTVFRPSEVTGSHKELPDVKLTGLFIAGNPVSSLADSYTVSYLDNSIALEFSLLDFNNPRNIIYEHRINDEPWLQHPEGDNSIVLSHLQPGSYNIEVRAKSGTTYSNVKTILLKVTPPWYRSRWAQAIYLIVFLCLFILIGYVYRRQAILHLDEEKMRFLINATHDIRSPLTVIMGATEKLKNLNVERVKGMPGEALSSSLDAIDRNAQRLLELVNQILDQRRLDKNQLQVHCQETNLVDFIGDVCKLYQFVADQRAITFTFEHEKQSILAWVDHINFNKVISNLLSNAFKYTHDSGEVKVVLREMEKSIEISVIDDGMGIKEDNPDRLFDRFYQGRNRTNLGIQGTGIGLNLCRAITQMHGGTIRAQRRTDKQGACFIVTLPKGNKHLTPEQIVTETPVREVLSAGDNAKRPSTSFRILIVDDDAEIARFIISELGFRYKFTHAHNGKEALKLLIDSNAENTDKDAAPYDLVISDMMMPEMDGLTLLKHIKENAHLAQLPVIMLTSKAEVENKLEGLRSGADAYIAKPFDMEELHVQIDNLIDNVRRLRGKFSGALQQEERVENVQVKGNDDALMERIMRSVNAHLSEPGYNVDVMAAEVGISRAQLHRKMKEITGTSTGKFLRNIRMEQAARLLREGKINISQIADCVGYADNAHFSVAFKNHFGISPSEYVEKHKS